VTIAATVIGGSINFIGIDPIKALFWTAVISGVAAVPIMAMIMHMASSGPTMGHFKIGRGLRLVGWVATAVMAAATVGMFATVGK
jgi:Mn2+/Fe2+ NRAMP family transporter